MLVLASCGTKHRTTVLGEWGGLTIRISNPTGSQSISLPVEKYGYALLLMNPDSTFAFDLGVLKDVRVEHEVFGVKANTVLIPAVYKSRRFGVFTREDSTFALRSGEKKYELRWLADRSGLEMNFTDNAGRSWRCTLEPKD